MRWVIAVALVFSAAGCIEAELVRCGDLLCPATTVCTTSGCVTQDRIDACVGVIEGGDCSAPVGVCIDGVCQPVVCGDGRMIGPELCDDSNQRSGDGCSADCLSAEACGNNYVDSLRGEECDSGPHGLAGDGCSSTCTTEISVWRDVTPVRPPGRRLHAMAFDEARGRVVMFGGAGVTFGGDTWEWDGVVWRELHPISSPPPRDSHAMAYDPISARTLLFGGTPASDTWAWDGQEWTQLQATSTVFSYGAAMAFDRKTEVIIMRTNQAGTWRWDGATWILITNAGPRLSDQVMVWEERGSRLLLHGEPDSGSAQTWGWDGASWAQLSNAGPTNLSRLSAAPDGYVVAVTTSGATWRWEDTAWVSQAGALGTCIQPAMAFDMRRNRTVLFGGSVGANNVLDDTWVWDGAGWELLPPIAAPPIMNLFDAAFISRTGVAILLGTTLATEAWTWDGSAWSPNAFPSFYTEAMVATRQGAIALGSTGTYALVDGVWQLASNSLPTLYDVDLAYDGARDRVVALANANGSSGPLETWEWDGATWMQMTPQHVPPYRSALALASDQRRGRVVLIAGRPYNSLAIMDTWEWDGIDWVDRTPTTSLPPAREMAAAVFHPLRGTIVMHGGYGLNSVTLADTWEWDGTEWRLVEPVLAGPDRYLHSMFFDSVRGEVVLFGGEDHTQTKQLDTWSLTFSSAAHPRDRCIDVDTDGDTLIGCDDPDCWSRCSPDCSPIVTCTAGGPSCGDTVCSVLEDHRLCPIDCP